MYKLIPTNARRQPLIPSFKDALPFDTEVLEAYENLGVLIPKGRVVLDFDDARDYKIFDRILKYTGIKTFSYKTTKGKHYWFKTVNENLRTEKKAYQPVGTQCEMKVGGRNATVHIKMDGKFRTKVIKDDAMAYLPTWAIPKKNVKLPFFIGLKNGDGRYNKLFEALIPWLSMKLSIDDIKGVVDIINNSVFDEPTDNTDKLFKGNHFIEQLEEHFRDPIYKTIKPGIRGLVDHMLEAHHIVKYETRLWLWKDNHYVIDTGEIERLIYTYWPNNTSTHRREIIKHIENLADEKHPTSRVQFKNGYLHNKEFTEVTASPEHFTPTYIDRNVKYHEKQEHVYQYFFSSIAQDQEDLKLYLESIIAYMLDTNTNKEKAFVLNGSGRNGKSTYTLLLEKIMGHNASSLSLTQITNNRFMQTMLLGKMANISNDIDNKYVAQDGIFKTLISWETIVVEQKGKDAFQATPRVKFIFTTNMLPTFNDKTNGVIRRLVVVPFDADFLNNPNEEYEDIKDRVCDEDFIEHALWHAIDNLKTYNITKMPEAVTAASRDYKRQNSSVIEWLDMGGAFYRARVKATYIEYKIFCDGVYKPVGNRQFDVIMKAQGYTKKNTTMLSGTSGYVWVNTNPGAEVLEDRT